jgi:hypothetical protein
MEIKMNRKQRRELRNTKHSGFEFDIWVDANWNRTVGEIELYLSRVPDFDQWFLRLKASTVASDEGLQAAGEGLIETAKTSEFGDLSVYVKKTLASLVLVTNKYPERDAFRICVHVLSDGSQFQQAYDSATPDQRINVH